MTDTIFKQLGGAVKVLVDTTKTDLQQNINTAKSGRTDQNFSVNTLTVAGNIIPTTNSTIDIGSATFRFRTIYVDEARLSTNTLYIGDTPIIGTDNDTINIHADPDQSINMKTQGTGTTLVTSAKGVSVETTGMNADVVVQASGTGSKVRLGATAEVEVTAPLDVQSTLNVTGATTMAAVTINGNLTVNGTNTIVNSTTVTTDDTIIILNAGEVGSGVTALGGKAGIQVARGEEADYQILFDEDDDLFKVGMVGQLEIIASRPWVTTNFSETAHSHNNATTSTAGFMSAADKTKLDEIPVSTSLPYDTSFSVWGKPTDGEVIVRTRAVRPFTIANTGHIAMAVAAATASTTFVVAKNGTQIGTIVFAAAGTTGTCTISETTFAIGDKLDVTAPGTADTTLSDIDFSLMGSI